MTRYISLDIGQKRTGIACTDSLRIIATALETVKTHELEKFLETYFQKEEVSKIVIGMPKDLNNNDSDAVKYIKPIINRLIKVFKDKEIITVDERFTSKMAFQTMLDGGVKKMKRREKETIDKISATIILQSYLEQEKHNIR